jgi:DNA repair exonuclease SbcCD ATPase subunit
MKRLIILSTLLFLCSHPAPGAEPVLGEEFNALKKTVEDLREKEASDRQNITGLLPLKDTQTKDHETLFRLQASVKAIEETKEQLTTDIATINTRKTELAEGLERVRKLEGDVRQAMTDAQFARVYLTAVSSVAGFVVILCSLFFSVRLTSLYERTAVQEALQTHIIDLKSRLAVLEARPGVEEP